MKELAYLIFGHADTAVRNLKLDLADLPSGPGFITVNRNGNRTGVRKFNRISEKVDQYLTNAGLITTHHTRNLFAEIQFKLHPLLGGFTKNS